jgi:hypothetical protein
MLKRGRANSCKSCVVKYARYYKLDLIGQKFGKRTVLEEVGKDKWGAYLYKTKCECGTIDIVPGSSLKRGKSDSCKCFLAAGDTFGKRTVLEFVGSDEKNNRLYRTQCICGEKSIISASKLRMGIADSCQLCAVVTHGLSAHPLHRLWKTMVARCYNPKNISYKYCGSRGIQVYESWRQSPKDFIEYIESYLGPKPTGEHQLYRINNNGNYEPGNVRWATPKENCNNRRNSKAQQDK